MQIIQLVIHALIFVAINDAATVKPLKPLVPSEDDYTHNIIADEDNGFWQRKLNFYNLNLYLL